MVGFARSMGGGAATEDNRRKVLAGSMGRESIGRADIPGVHSGGAGRGSTDEYLRLTPVLLAPANAPRKAGWQAGEPLPGAHSALCLR